MNSKFDHGEPSSQQPKQDLDDMSFELSSRRTGLSFQRTRMSADRTLMSVIRTSFALIGFGFTIYQFFRSLRETVTGAQLVPDNAARNFGLALITLGVVMLVLGIWYHIRFMLELRAERRQMIQQKLVHGELAYPVSLTLIIALLLLLLGLVAIVSIVTRAGPFN
jgi:putative membrane protein